MNWKVKNWLTRLPAYRRSHGRAQQTAEEERWQPGGETSEKTWKKTRWQPGKSNFWGNQNKIGNFRGCICICHQTCQVSFALETLTLEASDSLTISSQSVAPTSFPPPPTWRVTQYIILFQFLSVIVMIRHYRPSSHFLNFYSVSARASQITAMWLWQL